MNIEKFKKWVFNRHDVYCNQKYGDNLPYSFHLNCVYNQGKKFFHLLPENEEYFPNREIVKAALIGHDCLEDARMSYNQLMGVLTRTIKSESEHTRRTIADIIYCVTDEKGKNRTERKNDKYYKELKENKLAVFVKLSDIAANTLYSKLSGSSMYEQYKKEFPKFKEKVYTEEYEEFFNYVENL